MILRIKFFILIIIFCQHCCTKQCCVNDYRQILLFDFTKNELDSISIVQFEKNTNFISKTDSNFFSKIDSASTYFILYLENGLNTNFDYKIIIHSLSKTYELNQFEYKKEGCNTCFPFRPASDFYDQLISYQVNGIKQKESLIKIFK